MKFRKLALATISLSLMFVSLNTLAATITATHDYSYSEELTENIYVQLDFGESGRGIENITIDFTFSDNLFDPGDNLGINFPLLDPFFSEALPYQNHFFNDSTNSLSHLNTALDQEYRDIFFLGVSNLYVDDEGLATIILGSNYGSLLWGDGVNISNMVITADLVAVPLPAAVWLFSSGLVGLIGFAKRKKT